MVNQSNANMIIHLAIPTNRMKYSSFLHFSFFSSICFFLMGCGSTKQGVIKNPIAPKIDLSHWKVTIPTPREDGRPMEFSPPEILDYPNIDALKDYMYPDSTDGSIVFYTYPASSTANSKYSRSELREQMIPGDNDTNWKFADGGYMKVTMSVPDVSREKKKMKSASTKRPKAGSKETTNVRGVPEKGKGHRVIIAQIHGKLSKEQQKLIGQKDTNAPPILKVYYQDGRIQVKTKKLKKFNPTYEEVLVTKNWIDDDGHTFNNKVGRKKFTLEVKVSEGRLEVILNGDESVVYNDVNMLQWGVFYNYFKTGNYLTTRDRGAYAKVKIYDLEVSH